MSDVLPNEHEFLEALAAEVVDDFLARQHRGEHPDIEEYVARYPEQASAVREVLGAMQLLRNTSSSNGGVPPLPPIGADLESTIPSCLGDYRLLREVGRGGMGVVYEAEQLSLRRRVALKVLPFAATLDSRQLQRFKNEALAVACLNHPHIVDVYGVGTERGISFYAMRYIDGHSLAAVIHRLRELQAQGHGHMPESLLRAVDPLPSTTTGTHSGDPAPTPDDQTQNYVPESEMGSVQNDPPPDCGSEPVSFPLGYFRCVAEMGCRVAEALEHAHQHGVVHRDIKPSNLLLDREGKVWVADFGLAHVEREPSLTGSGDVIGTWRYMAPEQTRGQRGGADPRSDVYSLGVTLYEALTLQPAFPAAEPKVLMRQIVEEEPPRLRRVNRSIPADLETIILKAMSKEPAERYNSAQELADDLRRFLDDEPILARRPSLRQRVARWVRRHQPVVWTAAIAAVLLLLSGVVGQGINTVFLIGERDRAQRAEQKAQIDYARALISEARWRRQSGQPGRMFESRKLIAEAASILLQLHPEEEQILDLRDEAIACEAVPADVRLVRELGPVQAVDQDFCLSAWNDPNGVILVRRLATGEVVHRFASGKFGQAWSMRFSPDAKFLGARYLGGKGMLLWSLEQGRPVFTAVAPPDCCAWEFTADGRQFLFGGADRAIHFLDLATLRELSPVPLPTAPGPASRFRLSPDGRRLAVGYGGEAYQLDLVDLQTGKIQTTLKHPDLASLNSTWSWDGTRLAVRSYRDFQIQVWDVENRKVETNLRGHRWGGGFPAFSPHHDLLMSYAWDGTSRLWDPTTGQEHLSIRPSGYPHFRADGRQVVLASSHGTLWDVGVSRALQRLQVSVPLHQERCDVAIRPDGRLLACASNVGARLCDLHARREIASLPIGRCVSLVFHPEDGSLVTCGLQGVHRWPIHLAPNDENRKPSQSTVQLDPPELLVPLSAPGDARTSLTPDGRTLAVLDGANVVVLEWKRRTQHRLSGLHHNASAISISPDGKWVATATWHGYGIRLWDVAQGKLLAADLWPEARNAGVLFSPDGRWLMGSGEGEYRCWEVGTWRRTHRFPGVGPGSGSMAFAPDGGIVALTSRQDRAELYDPVTGKRLARLESLDAFRIAAMRFSRDGGQLAALDDPIQVWDLRSVRQALGDLGLDWDRPPYPPADVPEHMATPLQVTGLSEALEAWKRLQKKK